MNIHHVVVFDPSGELPEGLVFSNPAHLAAAHAKGMVTLPVDEDLLPGRSIDPSDGYSVRYWGAGWAFDVGAGERGCPMLLRVLPQRPYIHWVASVAPIADSMRGQLRLVTNSGNPVYASAGLSPIVTPPVINRSDFEERERHGQHPDPVVVRGLAQVSVSTECLMALNLHAVAKGMRVLWSAVSHCEGRQ
jgi:hypothetical protein